MTSSTRLRAWRQMGCRAPLSRLALFIFIVIVATTSAAAQELWLPLPDAESQRAAGVIQHMREDPRGPYLRIRWHCIDGTIHPPQGTPCREHGGGFQYADRTDEAKRLDALGIYAGTILQALDWEAFWDAANDHHRLKAYVLENYLSEVDDGWVLRRGRFYRGARQIEDEEDQGQAFLQRLLSNSTWTRTHFLLASQLVAVVPHLTPGQRVSTPRIRNLATTLADLDERFEPLRTKLHSFPSAEDVDTTEAALASQPSHDTPVRAALKELVQELRSQYDRDQATERLRTFGRLLGSPLSDSLASLEGTDNLAPIAALTTAIHGEITTSADGERNLVLMDLNHVLQERAFVLAQPPRGEGIPSSLRRQLAALGDLFDLAAAAGYLSTREHDALAADLDGLREATTVPALDYKQRLDRLETSLDWARATVAQSFGPSVRRYAAVEPRAAGFSDALLRGSIVLPLARRLDALRRDVDQRLGHAHLVFGQEARQGVEGLNPGVVLGRLEILDGAVDGRALDPSAVYVLPELPSEMTPVAGVLTLNPGGLLSHVQLLARNLGVPNASIPPSLLPRLQSYRGHDVFFAVSPLGRVILKDPDRITDAERRLVEDGRAVSAQRIELDTTRLRLDDTHPILLSELSASDAGVRVGPKAANLADLSRRVPGAVPPGFALPFGMYLRHIDRPYDASGRTLHEDIQHALRRADELAAQGRREEDLDHDIIERLSELRHAIIDLEWIPDMRDEIVHAMHRVFRGDLQSGVFVRSDTNVEDLPQFSGAGLNLTVPHQTSEAAILAAIKRVWASPLRERPYRWRRQILTDQRHIYPSVLLLRSVPSEKSGVLVTSGLQYGNASAMTIVTGEGVGGAVEGEPGETLLVDDRGDTRLLSQAKSPYYRVLNDDGTGGIRWVPSARPDYVLTPPEVDELIHAVDEWKRAVPAGERSVVWDLEFGFAEDRLWLFQVRPFVPYRSLELTRQLERLDDDVLSRARRPIDLTTTDANH